MDRFQGSTEAVKTPITDGARFVVTQKDVGSDAVRPGLMAEVEHERYLLLRAAKLVIQRIDSGSIAIGAPFEMLLRVAVGVAESRK